MRLELSLKVGGKEIGIKVFFLILIFDYITVKGKEFKCTEKQNHSKKLKNFWLFFTFRFFLCPFFCTLEIRIKLVVREQLIAQSLI